MVNNSKFSVDEASLRYQARTKLTELASDVASTRSLNRANDKILQATKIRLWLKALDLKQYLTREQRERIWYALIDLSDIYDFPVAPVLSNMPRPSILLGGGGGSGSVNEWGDIEGTLSNQTDLQTALDAKVDENSPITGDTKTKITYDSKGLVTAGADAGIADISGLQTALDGKVPYTGATGNVNLGEYGLSTGYLQFDITPTTFTPAVGNMGWVDTEGTIDFLLRGGVVNLPLGQKQVARVVNGTAGNVLKSNYQVVKVIGAQGQRLQVGLAQANNDANSADTLGFIAENINNNNTGFIVTSGLLENIDTTGSLQGETWADGNVLYLSPTIAGRCTNIKPQAPQHTVILGFVVYAHANNGKIYTKVDNGYEIDELHNVRINTGTLANSQSLKYNTSLSVWENISSGIIVDQNNVENAIRNKTKFIGHTVLDEPGLDRVSIIRQQESQYRFETITVIDQDIWTSASTITRIVKSVGTNTVEYKINAGSYIALTFTSGVWTGSISVAANDVLSWRITYNAGYTNCSFNVIHNRV